MPSRGMGAISPSKVPRARRRGDEQPVIGTGKPIRTFREGGSVSPEKIEKERQKEYLKRNPQYREREKGLEPVPVEILALGGMKNVAGGIKNAAKNLATHVINELLAEGRVGARTPVEAASQIARRAAIEGEVNEGEVKKAKGGKVKSKVNQAGNYTKPGMRKALFNRIKASATQGTGAGQWSARKAQLLAKQYKAKGGGYRG